MRRISYFMISLTCLLCCLSPCNAQLITAVVPFQNVFLNPNDVVQAGFSFGPHSQLFCFATNTQIVGIIHWPYQGNIQTGNLPIFLKTNPIFSGSFTDPNGGLTIQNTTNQLLQVGCLFGY